MKRVEIKQSGTKQIKLVILCIIMIAVSVFVIYYYTHVEENIYRLIIGIISLIFFGGCSLFIFKRLVSPVTVLAIDENGFTDRSSASALGFIPWKYVDEIKPTSLNGQEFISVSLNEAADIKISKMKQKLIDVNLRMGLPAVNITLMSAKAKREDVIDTMQKYLADYRIRQIQGFT